MVNGAVFSRHGALTEKERGFPLRLTSTVPGEYREMMENQSVVLQCPRAVKAAACICVVAAVTLPWLAAASDLGFVPGIVLGIAGVLLAVASLVCSVVALCRKSVGFGITMILVGALACGVVEAECMYLIYNKKRVNLIERSGRPRMHVGEETRTTRPGGSPEKSEDMEKDRAPF